MGLYNAISSSNSWTMLDDFECNDLNGPQTSNYLDWNDFQDRQLIIARWFKDTTPEHKRCWKSLKNWKKQMTNVLDQLMSIGVVRSIVNASGYRRYISNLMYMVNRNTGEVVKSLFNNVMNTCEIIISPSSDLEEEVEEVKYTVGLGDPRTYRYFLDDKFKNNEIWFSYGVNHLPVKFIKLTKYDTTDIAEFMDSEGVHYYVFDEDHEEDVKFMSKILKDLKDIDV